MYSATPPEKVTTSIGARHASASSRSRLRPPAGRQLDAQRRAESFAGRLDANDASTFVEAHEARAHVERGEIDHLAAGAYGDLRGAAADVDVHHGRVVADRARNRAGAVGGERRLQIVAGAHRD